jgi:CBS domain-containing protein
MQNGADSQEMRIMKVKDIMTVDVVTCGPDDDLAKLANLMWHADCGAIPVVDGERPVGVVTDRDAFVALATRFRPAQEIRVREVMSGRLWTCSPEDDLQAALKLMAERQVRRLPVVADGRLCGIVSLNDLAVRRGRSGEAAVADAQLARALREVCRPHMKPTVVAAGA